MITIPPHKPVLIAGPTASGKSALALHIARTQGGVIVNADALQVFDGWRIITARPDDADLGLADHALYGHIPYDADYSVGHWLRDVTPYLQGDARPIIIGGTGLNFAALTQGLAEIPATPDTLRSQGNELSLNDLLRELDSKTSARIDIQNRMRVQRAWEVLKATGRPLADWQDETPPPLLPESQAVCLNLNADPAWLNDRISRRFDQMIAQGVLDEARAMLPTWDPTHASSKAIGAPELIAHLNGTLNTEQTRDAVIIGSRQYAKRQRTWFRSRHRNWHQLKVDQLDISATLDLPK
ncbi:tRNA (adenosine(37)-N6)-dimethylallyltransferase MiaA [Loktanella sp. D2R18]|uniref:tRNA (adenosine(37)-N6)-dimethylallyltransferase MiaA n=1 Tax=Rhodobacterales TaxID=204455 RepID=UPI000DE87227|nr:MULTISPECIES: tRNA (adenosine(37)-N6)-dimethylallyltransferase MiaA [Rhodobacterales]MDO6589578.1 tRNA (adenosine(37)-N6)-dimethylallyltransferase MiaA [Yoonia sp. 1_MG-2023]RBW44218.1 tRNA (adenosine(37)-N6)-dimethylallyltransferase MiaA [Loktanella sp. D2R18]